MRTARTKTLPIPGWVPRFALVSTDAAEAHALADGRRPHAHQLEAWKRLDAHLAESVGQHSPFQGLLVMPTGGGKTYTTVRWLAERVLRKGERVLWLAHRQELLNQAGREFHQLAALAHYPGRAPLRVRLVSGQHCATTQIDPADDVIVASIASLARRPDIIDVVLQDNRFVVVDEAHHAPATSYRELLTRLQARPEWRLLGITATPTRTAERERAILAELFGGRVLSEVPIRTLIERGILSRPIPVSVKTGVEAERGVTQADLQNMARFDDLSEEWKERLAHEVSRNRSIVNHLHENRERYGKTLIFALNVRHAALLTTHLREAKITAEYVASYRPDMVAGADEEAVDVERTLERFRQPDGDLQALVNVQMLTEGVDVPCVKTVFLTRPTKSEILLRQMIGRGLRGTAANGTDVAYIVSFEDHWASFSDWESPLSLVSDLLPELAGPEAPVSTIPVRGEGSGVEDALPWEYIRGVAAAIRRLGPDREADAFAEAVPHGWYRLERFVEGEAIQQVLPIYEHQRIFWEELLEALFQGQAEALSRLPIEDLRERFFFDCEPPRPALADLQRIIEHIRDSGSRPSFEPFAQRELCDPRSLAKKILAADLREREKTALLKERYTPLAQGIYPAFHSFRAAVDDALLELQVAPDDEHAAVPKSVVFEPLPSGALRPGGVHDLQRLMQLVLERAPSLLGELALNMPPKAPSKIEWSERVLKGWVGMAYWSDPETPAPGRIRLNKLLDTPDVMPETLQFLLWHEYLHLYLREGHTKQFRTLEGKWPGHVDADRELDNLGERFGFSYR
jgi:superfamily II DNA or RNA helicase